MDDQQPTTSKALFTKQEEEMDKIKNGQEDKRLKTESKPEPENEAEAKMKSFIEELPPEMLMKILKYLDIKSLFCSRPVKRKWSGMATEILKSRKDAEITVYYDEIQKKCLVRKYPKLGLLADFMDCMQNSKSLPYTRFVVYVGKDSVLFDQYDWNKFISDFVENIKCLKIRSQLYSDNDLIKFAEKLKCLLVSQLPKLEQLGLYFDYKSDEISIVPSTHLFKPNEQSIPIHLPHLKVLHVLNNELWNFTGILTDLLRASVNLQKIECFETYEPLNFESLCLLQSLGKVHCLETANIFLTTEFSSKLNENPSAPLGFKLKKLNLNAECVHFNRNSWSDAADFMSNLFESSKDTLKNLEMEPLEFLPGLQVPKFSKLTNLFVEKTTGENSTVLPSGLNFTENFPVLQFLELKLPWSKFFPHDQVVTCIPHLTRLEIVAGETTQRDIVRISEVCPKLKEFAIGPHSNEVSINNFSAVGKAIWTHMKQLKSLKLRIYVDSSTNAFPAVDSCFTGFSGEDSSFLYDWMVVEKLEEKWKSRKMIFKSKLEAERKNPSILDLKELRELTVVLVLGKGKREENIESLYKNALVVSEKYALQLMENLDYKIHKLLL